MWSMSVGANFVASSRIMGAVKQPDNNIRVRGSEAAFPT